MSERRLGTPAGTGQPGADELAGACIAGFADRYGTQPAGVWSAPGRVNLIGEHTDYNHGYVLPFAIDRRATVAAAPRSDRRIRLSSSAFDGAVDMELGQIVPGAGSTWSGHPLGVVWALMELADGQPGGADMFIDSRVPTGSGLASSAAAGCAVAIALDSLWGLGLAKLELVLAVQRAENVFVGSPTGIMDQYTALYAENGCGLFIDCGRLESLAIPMRLDEAGLTTIIINTRQQHANSAGGYARRRTSCEAAASLLGVASLRELGVGDLDGAAAILDEVTFRRARHVITENERVLRARAVLEDGDPAAVGGLLDTSHRSMRDDFEISTPALDRAVEAAREAGATGARMTGGGFGGSAIALVPVAQVTAVRDTVSHAFLEAAFERPEIFTVKPSLGARRDS